MHRVVQSIVITGLFLLATTLTGCIKYKQVTTVMPDGSGKIELSFALSEQMIAMSKEQGQDPFEEMSPKKLGKDSKGIVAFTKPVQSKADGYTYMTFTAYFEDINQVQLGDEENDKATEFQYKRDGGTATLTVKQPMIASIVKDYEPIEPAQRQAVAPMLAGMMFTEHYVLPGLFEDIKGVTAVDNTAKIEADSDDMLNGTGAIQDFKGVTDLVFKIKDIKEDEAAMKAFKAELQQAVAEWEKIKEEPKE